MEALEKFTSMNVTRTLSLEKLNLDIELGED